MKYLIRVLKSKPFLIAAVLVVIYTLAGFFLAPYLIRHYVPDLVHEKLHKKASLGVVRFNPYVFTFEANDFRMTEEDGSPLMGFKRLFIDFELKSIYRRAWTFCGLSLEEPAVLAVIGKDGGLNLASLSPPSEESPQKGKPGKPPRLVFEDFAIDRGRIDAIDRRQSQPAGISVQPLTLHLKNLSTVAGEEGEQTFTATTTKGEKFQGSGNLSLNPVASKGRFSVENLRVATLTQFARDALNLEQPGGKLDLKAEYSIDVGQGSQVTVSNFSLAIQDLSLKLQGAPTPFLELPEALLADGRMDLAGRKVEIGSIALKGGKARLEVGEDGNLNAQRIVRSPESSISSKPEPAVQGNPWKVVLNGFELGGFALDYSDQSRTPGMKAAVDQLSVALKAELEAGSRTSAKLSDIMVGISGIQTGFADAAEGVVRLGRVALRNGAYLLEENRLTAGEVSIEGGSADVRLESNGSLNLAGLFQPGKGAASKKLTEAEAGGQPFGFLLNKVSLSGLQAGFTDLSVREDGPILSLEDVSTVLSEVDGRSPMKFDLSIQVREGGRIEASGTVDPSVPSVDSKVQVAELALPPLQPYIAKVAETTLHSGTFSTQGTLQYGIRSAKAAQTEYRGGFKIEKLVVKENDGGETLVGWNSVKSDQLRLELQPNRVSIGDVLVSKLTGKIIVEKDRSLNLARVIKSGAKPGKETKTASEGSSESFPYRVGRVLLTDGRVDFADMSLPVPFGSRVHELKGSISGISSRRARAQVKLDGRVDDYGTANVAGELNTSNPKAFTDIGVVFRNVEMSRLTPYSGKFAGRKIDSGKLSVDLKYKITDGQLTGDNRIVVDRLKLGEKVESPDALNLPLDLAVALLEDSNGVIDLGLPVHGDLNSPQFSYGALIGKAIVNLITKIVTSPFRALAALIPGGGEETHKNVFFEPGSAEVSPPVKEKLVALGRALEKRPQLKLSVQGRYNAEIDSPVLRTIAMRRALALRLGVSAPDMNLDVDYGNPETLKALESMFSERLGAEKLKTVKDALKEERDKARKETVEKERPSRRERRREEDESLAKVLFRWLEETFPVDEAALASLAEARAKAVIGELSGLGTPAERLALEPPAATEDKPVTAALDLKVTGR